MNKQLTIALAGNPNSGKTTIFNAITRTRQKVGNYPGVTVEKKEGQCRVDGQEYRIVDLPGTYSLTAYSDEELIARHFVLNSQPDVVIDIVDASNLERNLYLALQLIEMNVPLVLAFNMSDLAKRKGLEFDIEQLSFLLGVEIVEVVGNKGLGIDELLRKAGQVAKEGPKGLNRLTYGEEVDRALNQIDQLLQGGEGIWNQYSRRWVAIKLLEQDQEITAQVQDEQLLADVGQYVSHLEHVYGDRTEIILADRRYGYISGACQETVRNTVEARHDFSDEIDKVLTHPILGVLIFVCMMYVVFTLTFTLGHYPMEWLGMFFDWLGSSVTAVWPGSEESLLLSLIVDGIIAGVGGVIEFLPNILILFLGIAFLEDTGYMARAAFIMDRIMHRIGLHGKSFIPLLIGFGCSVPAVMATRILENRRNRLTTIMIIPLMSCGARFPIYVLLIPAFFGAQWKGPMMLLIYLVGIVLAIVCAKLLRGTLFKGETVPFVMELPPYRMPTGFGLLIHMWDRSREYIKKAGTLILAVSILLWAASTFPAADEADLAGVPEDQQEAVQLKQSVLGRVGRGIEPIIKPLGFDWKIGTGLVGAFAAKEVFVSQMGIIYSMTDESSTETLGKQLRADYTRLQAFCIMLYMLISMPCMATVAVTWKETGSWRWALFQVAGLTILAYTITLVVYQVGSLFAA